MFMSASFRFGRLYPRISSAGAPALVQRASSRTIAIVEIHTDPAGCRSFYQRQQAQRAARSG